MNDKTFFAIIDSLIGPLTLTSNGEAITGLYLETHKGRPALSDEWQRDDAQFRAACDQLRAYFAGELTEFDLPLAPQGTEFQKRVWSELRGIAYGSTINYGDLARRIGHEKAVRAVGAANGRNPISIIIPCHRVIGSNQKLTGYAGGVERKQMLLDLEAAIAGRKLGKQATSLF